MKVSSILLIILISLASCEKTYQCECKLITNGEDWNPKITNYPIKAKKRDSQAACKSFDYTFGWQEYQRCAIK